jgi:co-chaperonin GroES (HSP10)
MKSLHHFIIQLPEVLKDKFKTENGIELFADKRFSVDRLSNRVAKVIATPLFKDTEIETGYEVMIEPTFMYKQIYQGVTQDYTNYVDREKKWFRVDPNMIILFRKNPQSKWKGYQNNLMVEPIVKESEKITSSVLVIPKSKEKYEKEYAKVAYPNQSVVEMGVKANDTVLIDPRGGVKFWIDGKEYWWVRTKDIWGLKLSA